MLTVLAPIVAFAVGVASHLYYFRRFEHHLEAPIYFCFLVGALVLAPLRVELKPSTTNLDIYYAPSLPRYALIAAYLGGVYLSLLFYRLVCHPLKEFPGPLLARISDLWYSSQLANADAPQQLLKLHNKYGKFLRIGSSSLSITHPEALQAIYGLGTKCSKGPFYDTDYPNVSLHSARSRVVHDRRRRVWSAAFSDKALRGYEERTRPYIDRLIGKLYEFNQQPVETSAWFNYLAFDVMGDLAFNEDFQEVEKGEAHWAIKLLIKATDPFHVYLPTWLVRLLFQVPFITRGFFTFKKYAYDAVEKRLRQRPEVPDIMATLVEPYQKEGSLPPAGIERDLLMADARLLIVAGSDTTSTLMSHLFCHLCQNPQSMEKIRAEVSPFITEGCEVKNVDLQNLEYLNSCINETLRLNPSLPTMLQRLTPPEGLKIGDQFIPGNITVWSPQYVLGHDSHIYAHAEEFIPERWHSQPELNHYGNNCFAPFLMGPFGCIGKNLALMEVRTLAVKILKNFDVAFAPGETGENLLHRSRDHFTMSMAPMNLVFTPRKM